MNAVKYINPEGETVEVPEADAPWFDEQGWQRAESEAKATKGKGKNNQ